MPAKLGPALVFLLLLDLGGAPCRGQSSMGTAAKVLDSSDYAIVQRGPHWRTWGTITTQTNQLGQVLTQTNLAYTELATGLCYQKDGQWVDSVEQIDLVADGASATQGQHKVRWMGNANTAGGAVHLTTPDNKDFLSRVYGLSYFDASTGANILIAELKDSQGLLVGNNQIVYPDTFTDLTADLEYDVTLDGLEQNVILRAQPPSPSAYGLNPDTTRLQVYTEFFDPPAPQITVMEDNGIAHDAFLNFGEMSIGVGSAFLTESQRIRIDAGSVYKHWTQINGRTFLIEEIPYASIANLLQALPLHSSVVNPNQSIIRRIASSKSPTPKRGLSRSGTPIRVAKTRPRQAGLVVDYTTVGSVNNYDFAGNMTYYLSANAAMGGTNTTFEGGTLLKFASNVTMTVNSPVTWTASAYNPVILTAKDDSGVGASISGSTRNPGTKYYANTAFYFNASRAGTNLILNHLRVMNAKTAVTINGNTNHVLSDVQMVNCGNGLAATNAGFSLWNGLMYNVMTNFTGTNSTGDVEHLTVDTANWLNINETLNMTNCLLVAVTNTGTIASSAEIYTATSGSAAFQSAGLGAHYLAEGSPCVNAGTTNIAPALAAALMQLTTFPPVVLTANFSNNTTLSPQAQRDTDTPDVGYHYDPLDYVWTNLTVSSNVTLTLTNGVAVAVLGNIGVTVNGNIVSQGTPLTLNVLATASVVQEEFSQTNLFELLGGVGSYSGTGGGTWRSFYLRFTDLPMQGGSDESTYGMYFMVEFLGAPGSAPAQVIMQDCQVGGGCIYVESESACEMYLTLFNNLFSRSSLFFEVSDPGAYQVNFGNNLLHMGVVDFFYYINSQPGSQWFIYNNLFENSHVSPSGSGTNWALQFQDSNNAYIQDTGSELPNSSGGDLTPSRADYQTGALGSYYYPTTGTNLATLIFAGVGSGANVGSNYYPPATGLYHYTVTTNNVIEGTNIVSIGFHYVAVGSNGLPLDTNGDGIPDYLEDANGNGVVHSGEIDWQVSGDLGLAVVITQPANNSKIP
ncbi:MAG: hypothetical protein ABSH38_10260 [Verrucomicrobiota bacterium]